MNVSLYKSPPPHLHPWRCTPPNCFLHDHLYIEMYGRFPLSPDALTGPSDPYYSSLLETSYSINLSICFNRSLLETSMSWVCPEPSYCCGWQSQPWRCASTCFLNLRFTRPCNGEQERGDSNKGNFCNKNKHSISPIIIPMLPVSLTFYTASESLNSSSSAIPQLFRHQHCNAVAASPPPQRNPPLPKSNTIAAAVLWPLLIKNQGFFITQKNSLTNREHLGIPSMR